MKTTAHYKANRPAPKPPQRLPTPQRSPLQSANRIVAGLIVGAVGVLAVLALVTSILIAVLLTGDSGEVVTETPATTTTSDSTTASTVAPTTDGPATTANPATTTAPAPSTVPAEPGSTTLGSQPLTLRGMGPISFGMSVPEATEALGAEFDFTFGTPAECDYATIAGDTSSPFIMILTDNGDVDNGFIGRIDLVEGQTTLSGIGIGSTKADVLEAYGDRIVASPHPYGGQDGSEYLTYVPTDTADSNYRVIFETLDDEVYGVRAGTMPWVEWIEGCA